MRGVDNQRHTPLWMRERLRRAGLRSISPVVDVTNYVLLELGQPMHAYDLGKLKGGLDARLARRREPITLLDGKEIELSADVLVIADAEGAVGMAGVMGGERTSCTAATMDVFFEAAFFAAGRHRGPRTALWLGDRRQPALRARCRPAHQERALERATGCCWRSPVASRGR